MNHNRLGWLKRIGAPLVVGVLLLTVVGNLQAISDYVRLYGYEAPSSIAALAADTTMTAQARRVFYLNHPEVDDRDAFNKACTSRGEQTIVLGCYHSKDRGIFVFDVADDRLPGVEQVTAAHEMLHAAYDRLGTKERKSVNTQLQDFYDNHVTDSRIRDTVAAYQKSEPNDVVNEMHSIFATEIAQLTPELEAYYQRYFTDRSKVVRLADSYQAEFTSRQNQVASYDTQLATLKAQIDNNSSTLRQQETAISGQRKQLETYRSSGQTAAYNAAVPDYNTDVDAYNRLVQQTQTAITTYNQLVVKRNSIAMEVRQLTQSISSQPETISQ